MKKKKFDPCDSEESILTQQNNIDTDVLRKHRFENSQHVTVKLLNIPLFYCTVIESLLQASGLVKTFETCEPNK